MKQVKVLSRSSRTFVVSGREPIGDGHYSGHQFTILSGQISAIGENTFNEMRKDELLVKVDDKLEHELRAYAKDHQCSPAAAYADLYLLPKPLKPSKDEGKKEEIVEEIEEELPKKESSKKGAGRKK